MEPLEALAILLLVEIALLALAHFANRKVLATREARIIFALRWGGHRITAMLLALALILFAVTEVIELFLEPSEGYSQFAYGSMLYTLHVVILLLFMASLLPSFAYQLALRGAKA